MPIEQMNISISSQMARFVRDKVKNGQYTNASEVVRDALRRMQQEETANSPEMLLASIESQLTKADREKIRRGVAGGIKDLKEGRYQEYDEDGLRNLAHELIASSAKKFSGRSKAR